jgi:hypothetical protein
MEFSVLPMLAAWGAVATAVALVYLLIAAAAAGLGRWLDARNRRTPVSRPGEAVRRALKRTNGRLQRHGTAILLFTVSLGLLLLLGDRSWWPQFSSRVWLVMLIGLLVPQGYAMVKLAQLATFRQRLVRLLRLHEALGARLVEAQMRGFRLRYAVTVARSVIDVVATGSSGIYAIHVVVPPAGANAAQLRSDGLHFQPGGEVRPIRPAFDAMAALQRDIAAATGVRALVQPVLVVPDCRINRGDNDTALVVALESCVSFVGWRNPDAFLMDDELARVDAWLADQTIERDRQARDAAEITLGNAVRRPALV